MKDDLVPAKEEYPRKFVGKVVRFDLRRSNGVVTEEKGEVVAQQWLGLTQVGLIPEYEVTILGKTGRQVKARVTRDHVMEL